MKPGGTRCHATRRGLENPADEVGLVDTAALTQIGHRLADAIEFILHLWVGGQVCDGLPGDLGLGRP